MKKISIIALLFAMLIFLTSCVIALPPEPNDQNDQSPPSDNGDDPIKDSEIKDEPEDWGSSSAVITTAININLMKDSHSDINGFIDDTFDLSTLGWESECEGIATVIDGVVKGIKCGRTNITARDALGNMAIFTVTVEFLISENNGYNFNTVTDETVHKVTSEYEANRLIDRAIASHVEELSLDFSALGKDYVAHKDFDIQTEFGNHISLGKSYYESTPHLLNITINYEKSSATSYINKTPDNTYTSVANGNMIIRMDRLDESEHKRADDFEGFSINTKNSGTFKVYNSEELWWALEQNYKPEFAFPNSKVELFYERAKMILRDIITEDMDDLDKVIAISEYLTDAVSYDYDSFYNIGRAEDDSTTNICYYLEGVFERGVAVCDGKSKAFVVFCRIEGIECVRDFGSDPEGGAGHAWNYVRLGEKWYMVDTTGTDNSSKADTGIGQYYGKNVEFMIYTPMLASVFYHSDTYDYSGVFKDITDSASDADITDTVFKNKVYGTQLDFYIDSKSELKEITMLLLSTELCDDAILSFMTDIPSNSIWEGINSAISTLGSSVDYSLFTFESGADLVYGGVLKGI